MHISEKYKILNEIHNTKKERVNDNLLFEEKDKLVEKVVEKGDQILLLNQKGLRKN